MNEKKVNGMDAYDSKRVDLEHSKVQKDTAYFNMDDIQREQEKIQQASQASRDEDVRVFVGKPADQAMNTNSTRVIDFDEESEKATTAAKHEEEPEEKKRTKPVRRSTGYRELFGVMRVVIYVSFILVIATTLAWYAYRGVRDVTGIGRDADLIDIVIEEGDTTAQIAQKLKDSKVIEEPMFFRVYCRYVSADNTFHPGTHTLKANDGYTGIVAELQNAAKRESVRIVIPEGTTLNRIAELLEQNNVCTKSDFYDTIVNGDFSDYDFIAELTPEQREGRAYLLEGYLFPDTYDFLVECSADTAVRKMLDNFDKRINADTRSRIKASNRTLHDVLVEASIIQKEASFSEDMPRVARVITNRLAGKNGHRKLEMDSTWVYIENVESSMGQAALMASYDTNEIEGLPAGAICNPGIDAINAAMNPSIEPDIINCIFFASKIDSDPSDGVDDSVTKFFETLKEHEAWCRENGVGIYGRE